MTVAQLIQELQRYPADAEVGIQDHDAGDRELSAHVVAVSPFRPEDCRADSRYTENVRVVIRAG